MATINADNLEIDVTEMGVAGAAFANGVIAEQAARIAELDARILEYENALNWETSCLNCAKLLDASYAETVRAEQAEAQLAQVRADAQAHVQEWQDRANALQQELEDVRVTYLDS